jgi:hypothetical protein
MAMSAGAWFVPHGAPCVGLRETDAAPVQHNSNTVPLAHALIRRALRALTDDTAGS